MQTVHELKARMKKLGISKAVVFPFNEPKKDLLKTSMEMLRNKDRSLIPFMRFDPRRHTPQMVKEHIDGFAGVKLHPFSQRFDPGSRRMDEYYKVIEESGKPLIMHTLGDINRTHPHTAAKISSRFKDLTLILAHFAGYSLDAINLASKNDNLYLETSVVATPWVIKKVVGITGAEKILFGSDSPYSDQHLELETVKRADISRGDRELILCGNARRILGR